MNIILGSKKPLVRTTLLIIMIFGTIACSEGSMGTAQEQPAQDLVAIDQIATLLAKSSPASGASLAGRGIHVTGVGTVSTSPDLARVHVTVESRQSSVADARELVGVASNRLRSILARNHDVPGEDIETRKFEIQPEYDYRTNKAILLGYRVANSMQINVHDLGRLGKIIDDAAEAAGNSLRIDSVQFAISDPRSLEVEARMLAIKDALDRSDRFASATRVTRGRLLYISESYTPSPKFAMASGRAMTDSSTAITPGDLDVTVTVQAVFEIQ